MACLVVVAQSPERKESQGIQLGVESVINVNQGNAYVPYGTQYLLPCTHGMSRVRITLPIRQINKVEPPSPRLNRLFSFSQSLVQQVHESLRGAVSTQVSVDQSQ